MQVLIIVSLALVFELIKFTETATPSPSVSLSPESDSLVNKTSALQFPVKINVSGPAISPNDYPIDPYQMRVPGTTTSLIFSKYGPPIHLETFLNLIARAQYQICRAVVAAHGDGPVPQPNFEWSEAKLYVRISRPLAQEDLTWLILADTLEGSRLFFDGLRVWFETSITILDDTAGPVGSGSVTFW
ncbi:hypothetical protein HO133_009153 [Letharia lupina]|uniref:Uncharacterized protein n=1 Tax=Letharia lupina TaxID=560253 RepID=A0A8H6CMS8_9LECA|nr:uncharacterized protein HO133_009153 [Letharia lupina]KAF6226287.1 hypothetical protein HO133_009153 [Letharia lupina]